MYFGGSHCFGVLFEREEAVDGKNGESESSVYPVYSVAGVLVEST